METRDADVIAVRDKHMQLANVPNGRIGGRRAREMRLPLPCRRKALYHEDHTPEGGIMTSGKYILFRWHGRRAGIAPGKSAKALSNSLFATPPAEPADESSEGGGGLSKSLSVWDIIAYGLGSTVGAGLFVVTGAVTPWPSPLLSAPPAAQADLCVARRPRGEGLCGPCRHPLLRAGRRLVPLQRPVLRRAGIGDPGVGIRVLLHVHHAGRGRGLVHRVESDPRGTRLPSATHVLLSAQLSLTLSPGMATSKASNSPFLPHLSLRAVWRICQCRRTRVGVLRCQFLSGDRRAPPCRPPRTAPLPRHHPQEPLSFGESHADCPTHGPSHTLLISSPAPIPCTIALSHLVPHPSQTPTPYLTTPGRHLVPPLHPHPPDGRQGVLPPQPRRHHRQHGGHPLHRRCWCRQHPTRQLDALRAPRGARGPRGGLLRLLLIHRIRHR